MLILYAIFVLAISALAFFVYVVSPRRRRAALIAFAMPIGFGAGSILGLYAFHFLARTVLHLASFTTTYTLFGEIICLVSGLAGAWIAIRIVWKLEFRFPEQRSTFLRTAIAIVVFEMIAVNLLLVTSRLFFSLRIAFSSYAWYCTAVLSLCIASGAALFAYRFFRRPVDHWISVEANHLMN
jgi:hypothetical protein